MEKFMKTTEEIIKNFLENKDLENKDLENKDLLNK
jgi:hypothetical protein